MTGKGVLLDYIIQPIYAEPMRKALIISAVLAMPHLAIAQSSQQAREIHSQLAAAKFEALDCEGGEEASRIADPADFITTHMQLMLGNCLFERAQSVPMDCRDADAITDDLDAADRAFASVRDEGFADVVAIKRAEVAAYFSQTKGRCSPGWSVERELCFASIKLAYDKQAYDMCRGKGCFSDLKQSDCLESKPEYDETYRSGSDAAD